jgi:hypothetical protein
MPHTAILLVSNFSFTHVASQSPEKLLGKTCAFIENEAIIKNKIKDTFI